MRIPVRRLYGKQLEDEDLIRMLAMKKRKREKEEREKYEQEQIDVLNNMFPADD